MPDAAEYVRAVSAGLKSTDPAEATVRVGQLRQLAVACLFLLDAKDDAEKAACEGALRHCVEAVEWFVGPR